MKDFKQKSIKYLLILGAVYLFTNLVMFFSPIILKDIMQQIGMDDTRKVLTMITIINKTLTGLIFGIILYTDCRKEIKNQYMIPLLGVFLPVFGTILYFIEKYALSKTQYHETQA